MDTNNVQIIEPIKKKKDRLNLKGALTIDIPDTILDSKRNTRGNHSRTNSMENHCIVFPNQTEPVRHFALDIGGSLIKVVYFESSDDNPLGLNINEPKSPIYFEKNPKFHHNHHNGKTEDKGHLHYLENVWPKGGRICFAKYETSNIEECLSFIEELTKVNGKCTTVHATGGGAYKFAELLKKRLGITIIKMDEMQSLITGLNFLLKNIKNESFTYHYKEHTKTFISLKVKEDIYPYLLVNIGSGVSILKVTDDQKYERVSGSALGGGTFWGLCSLLTNCQTFDEMLAMTQKGDNKKVDMLVGDIYGRDYIGLSADTIASYFGKTARNRKGINQIKPEDCCKSVLFMISNNIAQIAYLNALRYNLNRIYFAGFFIRDHPTTMAAISYSLRYWSEGKMEALFLKHEGYLGAIGSFILPPESAVQNPHPTKVKKKTFD